MKTKKLLTSILSAVLCIGLLSACGSDSKSGQTSENPDTSQTDTGSTTPDDSTSQDEQSSTDQRKTVKNHTLYIRDYDLNKKMTACFYNNISGKTKDVEMKKISETDEYITYSCEGDVNTYNMVHVLADEFPSLDVAFNEFVSGWFMKREMLMPYVYDNELDLDPQYETKVFQFEGYDKNVYIWTPKDYDAKSKDKYSTIYLYDGQWVITPKIANMPICWNVCQHIESMTAETGNKAIVVAVETTDETRGDELIPDIGKFTEELSTTKQLGSKFADFLCDTIIPYIEQNYNVYTDAQHRAIAGSSLGGLESFFTAVEHPDKFGTSGTFSSSFWAFSEEDWKKFLDPKIKSGNLPFIYFYSGKYTGDNGDAAISMYNSLLNMGYPKEKLVFSNYSQGQHLAVYWQDIFPEFLEAMFTQNVTALESGVPAKEPESASDGSEDTQTLKSDNYKDYIYYDNSETKWEKVYAYWWNESTGISRNILTKTLYDYNWPGVEMERIGDTDIYRTIAPIRVSGVIFDTGVTDDLVAQGTTAYQTENITYDENVNPGQIYKIDLSKKPNQGRGIEKTKYRYPAGTWTDYKP